MGNTMPMRVDGDLFDIAKVVGAASSRSAAQQISHWARIGRELESSPATSVRDIQRVLAGEASYDELGERGQAVVRARWDEQMAERLASLNLASEFAEVGRSWTEADEQGRAVQHDGGVVD
jgi:lysozyme family protein